MNPTERNDQVRITLEDVSPPRWTRPQSPARRSTVLAGAILPELADANPGLTWLLGGERQQQTEFLSGLGRSLLLALFAIYALLAIPLDSYVKPLIVMSAIPFGMVGAIVGHLMLGIDLGFTSILGAVAGSAASS